MPTATPTCYEEPVPDWYPVSATEFAIALVVTFVAAAVQGSIGIGFGILSVPTLALVHPALAPVPQLLAAMPMTMAMAWRERHAVELRGVFWVVAGRLPGAAVGVALLSVASPRTLDAVLGGLVLAAALLLSGKANIPKNWATELAAGIISGASAMVSSIGGPPIALLYRNATGPSIRANLAIIFSIGVVVTAAARILAGKLTTTDAIVATSLLPAIAAGVFVSRWVTPRVEGARLRAAILVVAGAAGAALLFKSLR